MIIKKFISKTEEDALALAQKDLGTDVTIIHSRYVKPKGLFSFLKKMQVEITVAKEEEMDRPEALARDTLQKVNQARQKGEEAAADKPKTDTEPAKEEPKKADTPEKNAGTIAEEVLEEKLESIQNLLEQKLKGQAEAEKEKKEQKEEEQKQEDREKK